MSRVNFVGFSPGKTSRNFSTGHIFLFITNFFKNQPPTTLYEHPKVLLTFIFQFKFINFSGIRLKWWGATRFFLLKLLQRFFLFLLLKFLKSPYLPDYISL